jgi:hypothetical protein
MRRLRSSHGVAKLLVAALILLQGCGSTKPPPSNDSTPSPSPSPTSTATPQPTPSPSTVPSQTSSSGEHSLIDAANQGLVEYRVIGRGGSSGESLIMEIQRRTTDSVVVYVEAGTVFGTTSNDVQNMVGLSVRGVAADSTTLDATTDVNTLVFEPTTRVTLDDNLPHLYVIEAYCLNFALDNPRPQDAYRAQRVDVRAATLLKAADEAKLSIASKQAVVWMDREHITKEEIQTKFEANDQELEDAWQLLSRLPPP